MSPSWVCLLCCGLSPFPFLVFACCSTDKQTPHLHREPARLLAFLQGNNRRLVIFLLARAKESKSAPAYAFEFAAVLTAGPALLSDPARAAANRPKIQKHNIPPVRPSPLRGSPWTLKILGWPVSRENPGRRFFSVAHPPPWN
ncbi:hypothetical protein B0T22DRAFT_19944 [Podospora appendiculata]|uniref:Secreted protein n=1 Tax=Podospora appendiculata TaxID=314037 RepID=A0AAE0XFQ9_9PEZI|nr:hypothetical protein B0T22DRAFT_19944 [Podospora appendiculata]